MFDRFAEKAREAFFLDPQIYFDGDRSLVAENCRRIEEYDESLVQFVSGALRVRVWGSGLRAYDLRASGLAIRGRIERVEFIERRKDNARDDDKEPDEAVR